MTCEECRDLGTHAIATQADLVNAVQVAAQELDRGVLSRDDAVARSAKEDEAVYSARDAGAYPVTLLYRFRCSVCGDRFTLRADTASGQGEWLRNDEVPPPPKIRKER
jgi:hypothetical protein